jgi:hypothetical protein
MWDPACVTGKGLSVAMKGVLGECGPENQGNGREIEAVERGGFAPLSGG